MVRLFFASLLLSASALPALAAEACRTQGQAAAVEVPVAAANDAATLARAQMTLDALDPETTSQVPRTVSCSRGAINVDGTVYTIGGENGDPFPRTAAASGGSSTAYLYAVPGSAIGAATAYVLAVSDGSGSASAKTIFNGIPADAALTEAFRQALGPKAPIVSYDENWGMVKINPLATWTHQDLVGYAQDHDIPQHPLRAQGYVSIGCAPTTRPVADGDDLRSGRWADTDKVECGLHL